MSREIKNLKMTDGAYKEYILYRQRVEIDKYNGKYSDCEAVASKLHGQSIRLSAAINFLKSDCPWEKPIDSSSMRSGIALANFYAEHAMFAFDKKQNDSVVYARKILKWVKRRRKATFEQREAQRGVGHCKINQIEAGIDLLLRNSYLAQYLNYKGKMIYIVNPNTFRGGN